MNGQNGAFNVSLHLNHNNCTSPYSRCSVRIYSLAFEHSVPTVLLATVLYSIYGTSTASIKHA